MLHPMVAHLELVTQWIFKKDGIKCRIMPGMDLRSVNIPSSMTSYCLRYRIDQSTCWGSKCNSRLARHCTSVFEDIKEISANRPVAPGVSISRHPRISGVPCQRGP